MPIKRNLPSSLSQNNLKAFSFYYDYYASAIYGIICKSIYDTDEAEAILLEVFIKFKSEIDNGKVDGNVFIYLHNATSKLIMSKKPIAER